MTANVLFAGRPDGWPTYEPLLKAELDGLAFRFPLPSLAPAILMEIDGRSSLGEIHAQHQEVHDAAETQRKELTAGQKELSMAMLRLQGRVIRRQIRELGEVFACCRGARDDRLARRIRIVVAPRAQPAFRL